MNLITDNKSTSYPWEIINKPYTSIDEDLYNEQAANKWVLTTLPIGGITSTPTLIPSIYDKDIHDLYVELDKMVSKCVELTIKKIKCHFYGKYGSRKLTSGEIDEIKGIFTTSHLLNSSQYFRLIPMWKKDCNRTLDDLFFDYKIHNW